MSSLRCHAFVLVLALGVPGFSPAEERGSKRAPRSPGLRKADPQVGPKGVRQGVCRQVEHPPTPIVDKLEGFSPITNTKRVLLEKAPSPRWGRQSGGTAKPAKVCQVRGFHPLANPLQNAKSVRDVTANIRAILMARRAPV